MSAKKKRSPVSKNRTGQKRQQLDIGDRSGLELSTADPRSHKSPSGFGVKYRTRFSGIAPRQIRLQIPGWAGENVRIKNGAQVQPWHCQPFDDAATYGLELVYPFDTECRVTVQNGSIKFSGDFSDEVIWDRGTTPPSTPPFQSFAPQHYGFTSLLDILPPPGYVLRLEPHPRYYTDALGEVPLAITGHIERFWTRIFFVVFKAPWPGQTHVFRKGEPYAQVLIVPRKISYDVRRMKPAEEQERAQTDEAIGTFARQLAKRAWISETGDIFDDKYKQLKRAYIAGGSSAVTDLIQRVKKRKRK